MVHRVQRTSCKYYWTLLSVILNWYVDCFDSFISKAPCYHIHRLDMLHDKTSLLDLCFAGEYLVGIRIRMGIPCMCTLGKVC